MAKELVRCVNSKNDQWGMFPPSLANDKSFQFSTGFYPQELPKDSESNTEIKEKGKPGRPAKAVINQ
jgi:hypothetical protein